MKMGTNGMNTFLGGSTSVFMRIFLKKKNYFVPFFKKFKKGRVGEIRNTMFPSSPTHLLPEKVV
jgi:hypothetical protein